MDFEKILKTSAVLKYWNVLLTAVLVVISTKWVWSKLKPKIVSTETKTAENVYNDSVTNDEDDESYSPSLEDKAHIAYKGATQTLAGGAADFFRIVNDRRSVRSFSRQPIPPLELIEACIQSAGTAPSGAHTEPWTFCVISNGQLKESIRNIIESEEELNYAQRMHRQWTTDLRPLKTDHIKPYLTDAPYLILVFKQIYGLTKHGKRKQHYYNEISVSISVGILLCALQSAGLSSLVTTPLNCGPALRALLNRPSNEKLLVLMPVGYPAKDCKIPDLERKMLSDIMVKY